MSLGISGGKRVIEFANTSNRGRGFLFSENKTTIFISQNLQFKFQNDLRQYCLLLGHQFTVAILHPQKNK